MALEMWYLKLGRTTRSIRLQNSMTSPTSFLLSLGWTFRHLLPPDPQHWSASGPPDYREAFKIMWAGPAQCFKQNPLL